MIRKTHFDASVLRRQYCTKETPVFRVAGAPPMGGVVDEELRSPTLVRALHRAEIQTRTA